MGAAAWAMPSVGRRAWATQHGGFDDPDAGTGLSLGVASFDPTPDSVLLWTRVDDPADMGTVEVKIVDPDAGGLTVGPAWMAVDPGLVADPQSADQTITVDVATLLAANGISGGLVDGRSYTYTFRAGADGHHESATGTTRTLSGDPQRLRLAVASCQDWQLGHYAAWRDVAATDLDAVLFLGDYIYEYGSYGVGEEFTHADGIAYPTHHGRTHVVRPHRPATSTPGGIVVGTTSVPEAQHLDEYRDRYRLHRTDPALRLAHRAHPFICVWDDHEVAGDRYADGAVNHGDDENGDPREDPDSEFHVPYDDRRANGEQAYQEYLPGRLGTHPDTDELTTYRSLRLGSLAELTLLDSRTFRDRNASDASNRDFNPLNNRDVPAISDEGRTILGEWQKEQLKNSWRNAQDGGVRWKLVGNQLMMSPLNLASFPDVAGQVAEDFTKGSGEPLPVTWHRDGIPVNIDQWDGYHAERRELLTFLRHGVDGRTGDGEHALKQVHDVVPGASGIQNVVFLTGDIHIHWSMECHLDWGDAGVDDPVAVEFVGAGISSENFNERIGDLSIGRPLPHGSSGAISRAAIATNRHLRFADFDSNGWVYVDVDRDRVHAEHRVLIDAPGANPVENPMASSLTAPGASWMVTPGLSRLLPDLPRLA